MEGKSTVTQLTQVFHEIGQHVDNCGQVSTLCSDFSKAFDRVQYHLLLHKMKLYGLNGLHPISQDANNVYLFLDHYLSGFHRGLYWDTYCFYYTYAIYHFATDFVNTHYLRITINVQRFFLVDNHVYNFNLI